MSKTPTYVKRCIVQSGRYLLKNRLNLAALISCGVMTLLILLWIRADHVRDQMSLPFAGRLWSIETFPEHLILRNRRGWPGAHLDFHLNQAQYPSTGKYYELRCVWNSDEIGVALPNWLIALLTSTALYWWLINHLKRKTAEGCCNNCGYDLRASPERCPECGAITPPSAQGRGVPAAR